MTDESSILRLENVHKAIIVSNYEEEEEFTRTNLADLIDSPKESTVDERIRAMKSEELLESTDEAEVYSLVPGAEKRFREDYGTLIDWIEY